MGTMGLAPGLARKLKKVLDCRTDSPDLVASLNALSSFYTENNPQARRNLRSTIEKCSLQINVDFLDASRSAQLALDQVEEEVNALAESCDKIAKALNSCSASTGNIISTTERLKQELEITTQRQDVVSCFLRDYQLSSEELSALRDEELSENFFKALVHVQEIHSNCKLLLRTHHQRAGLELMDMMAVYQEGAFERLCRWVQAECRRLSDADNPEVGDLLKTAVHYLKERPVLFKYCTEEVANIRHNVLFRRFISALTRGGPGGLPRPIEVHAHDPLRYVRDMLGWIHQALASEREFILVLLGSDSLADAGSKKPLESINGKTESDLTSVLDRIFEGVCRPFKVRVEQVLKSLPSLIVAYKLSNTVEFYSYTIQDLIGKTTSLCQTLWHLKDAGEKAFFEILKSRGEKLLRYPPVVGADLAPPQAVREGVVIIDEILNAYNSMMVPESGEILEVNLVISATLDPVIQMCEEAAEAHKTKKGDTVRRRLRSNSSQLDRSSTDNLPSSTLTSPMSPESASKIFLINCLCCIQQPLYGYDVASDYTYKLGQMIECHIQSLVNQEVDVLLSRCGLSDKINLFRESVEGNGSGVPLSDRPETSPAILSDCFKAFFGFILGNDNCLPEFPLLQVPKLRSDASMKVASKISDTYQVMYTAIMDPKNGYAEPRSLARHPPDQITTILGL